MKAVLHDKYGPPSVAYVGEIDCPEPKDNELLIQVYASTVNRTDVGFRSAEYFVTRFWSGLFTPNNPVLGYNEKTFGCHAEFLTIPFTAAIAKIPKNINIHDAAAITEGSHYALNIIRAAKVKNGQDILVYGATGGIGSSAVQLLKYFGCNVTAVCSTDNIELVKNLGADFVIDYQTEDFKKCNLKFDFIFDAVGKTSFSSCKNLFKNYGIYISTELGIVSVYQYVESEKKIGNVVLKIVE